MHPVQPNQGPILPVTLDVPPDPATSTTTTKRNLLISLCIFLPALLVITATLYFRTSLVINTQPSNALFGSPTFPFWPTVAPVSSWAIPFIYGVAGIIIMLCIYYTFKYNCLPSHQERLRQQSSLDEQIRNDQLQPDLAHDRELERRELERFERDQERFERNWQQRFERDQQRFERNQERFERDQERFERDQERFERNWQERFQRDQEHFERDQERRAQEQRCRAEPQTRELDRQSWRMLMASLFYLNAQSGEPIAMNSLAVSARGLEEGRHPTHLRSSGSGSGPGSDSHIASGTRSTISRVPLSAANRSIFLYLFNA
jgi:hypothetical protein